MLTTQTYSIDETLATLDERIAECEAEREELDESSDRAQTLTAQEDRLSYFQRGLRWQRDEEEWGDAEIELGALTAGEKAMMHREAYDEAGRDEMRLWFVAASTVEAPYVDEDGDLSTTFDGLTGCHPAFAEWAEAQANGLGVPSAAGNRSSTSSKASADSETSTTEPDSTTTSSSDSPTE